MSTNFLTTVYPPFNIEMMSEHLFWFAPLFALILIPAIFFIWDRISMNWLNISAILIVTSLPFERLPSLDISGFTLRFSQLFTVTSIFFVVILLFKGELKNFEWSKLNYWFVGLLFALIPSLFFVENWQRFTVTFIATVVVLLAAFIIANFLKSRVQAIFGLMFSMILVGIFGVYQFFGDLLGLPISLTLLRETYTKKVFGFPRIHSTAIEPLYFAGMLFLPIFISLIFYLQPELGRKVILEVKLNLKEVINFVKKIISKKSFAQTEEALKNDIPSVVKNEQLKVISNKMWIVFLIFFSTLFIVTIAKGAWLAIAVTLPILIILTWKKLDWQNLFIQITLILCIIIPIFSVTYLISPQVQNSTDKVFQNFAETASGVSSTSTERSNFQDLALTLVNYSSITGIGSGQYGVAADRPLRSMKTDKNQYFIVNNVYLEIWLEEGLVFLIIFCGMWVWLIASSLHQLRKKTYLAVENSIHLAVLFAVISSLIQWQTFSPIYIMPIFILLGLLANFNQNHE